MEYDETFLEKVRAFGMLRYSVNDIIHLVEPEDPDQFVKDFEDPESELHKAYKKGSMTGKYTMDKALFDVAKNNDPTANQLLVDRQDKDRINGAIYERFGI